jgi:hypothetical protein
MKRRRLCLAVAAISAPALALGLALGGAASAAPAPHGFATGLYSERPAVISCLGQPEVRPGTLTLACADGNDYLTGLSWTSWAPRQASGYGTQMLNDCNPYCAAGHFHSYAVRITLWGSATVRGNPGTLRYTRVTLVYPAARPKVFGRYPGTVTMSLWP